MRADEMESAEPLALSGEDFGVVAEPKDLLDTDDLSESKDQASAPANLDDDLLVFAEETEDTSDSGVNTEEDWFSALPPTEDEVAASGAAASEANRTPEIDLSEPPNPDDAEIRLLRNEDGFAVDDSALQLSPDPTTGEWTYPIQGGDSADADGDVESSEVDDDKDTV